MSELKVTKDRVLKAAEKCADAKRVLLELFPEAFEKPVVIPQPGQRYRVPSLWGQGATFVAVDKVAAEAYQKAWPTAHAPGNIYGLALAGWSGTGSVYSFDPYRYTAEIIAP